MATGSHFIMSMLLILIPLSLLLVVVAAWAFIWAVGSGQFDDLETPGWEILTDESTQTDQPLIPKIETPDQAPWPEK
jgi:cbb3-type cytochrome oxidase maturation protein